MTLLACVAIIASFYILVTQGLAVLAARRTGVLVGKSPNRARIERAIHPQWFDELLEVRTKALRLPAFIAGAAILILAWTLSAMIFVFFDGLSPLS